MEEGMWAVLRRHFLVKSVEGVTAATTAAAASSVGLWKVRAVDEQVQ